VGGADADEWRRPTGPDQDGAGRQPTPRHARDPRRRVGSSGQRHTELRHGVPPWRAQRRTESRSGLRVRPALGRVDETRLNGAALVSRCQPETTRGEESPSSERRGESPRRGGRGDGGLYGLGISSAAEAVSTPWSEVWMTRQRGRRHRAEHQPKRVPRPGDVSLRSRVPGNRHARCCSSGGGSDSRVYCHRTGGQRRVVARWPSHRWVVLPPPLSVAVRA
jgi:hypothetical protein